MQALICFTVHLKCNTRQKLWCSIGLRAGDICSSSSEKFYGLISIQNNNSDYLPINVDNSGLKGRRRQMYDFLLTFAEASSSSMTSSSLELHDCRDVWSNSSPESVSDSETSGSGRTIICLTFRPDLFSRKTVSKSMSNC
ncbi:hypothetical protein T07_11841 [Trichinella nelsoni]|uniref:Uncharacterized protein n=1 Tax=Trichinella nelsoni TaxID=6336 RepID=A0A0V0SAP4_9BILA|nr:hypothetical protein T07_11841 [Trichinella nelsoni]